MSPHQRVLSFEASAVKSRRIASARAAAAGSGIVVFFHRLAALPRSPGNPLVGMQVPFGAQLRVDPRRPVAALGVVMNCLDLASQLCVFPLSCPPFAGQFGYGVVVVASPLGARGSRPSGRRAT